MAAQKERKQAVQLHVTFPGITIEDSYAISTDVMQRKGAYQSAAMRAFTRSAAEVSAADFSEALKQYIADRPEFDAPAWAPSLDSSEKRPKKIKIGFAPPTPEELAPAASDERGAEDASAEPPARG